MFNITIISVGRLKDRFYEDASAEYLKRLSSYAKVNVIEIKAADLPDDPGDALIKGALQKEGREIIKKLPADALAVSLCVEGKLFSSEELAAMLENSASGGISHIAFIIGGSYGLSEEVKSKTKIRLSMSKMTFPHRLARIMLLEQIYRAFKISKGERYHK